MSLAPLPCVLISEPCFLPRWHRSCSVPSLFASRQPRHPLHCLRSGARLRRWRARGEGNAQLASPHPPAPSPTAQSLGRGGASGVPLAYTANHSLTHSSQLPSPRKWERGGGAGVRGTPCAQLQARARVQPLSHFPSPPGPISHGASLAERGSLRRPTSLHNQPQPHPLLPAPLSPKVGEGWRSRGEGNPPPLPSRKGERCRQTSGPCARPENQLHLEGLPCHASKCSLGHGCR